MFFTIKVLEIVKQALLTMHDRLSTITQGCEDTQESRFNTYLSFDIRVRFIFSTVWEQNAKHKFACLFGTFVNQQFIVAYKI